MAQCVSDSVNSMHNEQQTTPPLQRDQQNQSEKLTQQDESNTATDQNQQNEYAHQQSQEPAEKKKRSRWGAKAEGEPSAMNGAIETPKKKSRWGSQEENLPLQQALSESYLSNFSF